MGERERRERASPPVFSVESRVQAKTTGRRGDVHGLDNGCSRRVVLPVLPARAPGDGGSLTVQIFCVETLELVMRMNHVVLVTDSWPFFFSRRAAAHRK